MKRGLKFIQHKSGVIQKVRIRRLTNLPGLGIARGPGSIHCQAEVLALARAGQLIEAADMGDAHDANVPERSRLKITPPAVRQQWRRYAEEIAAGQQNGVPA
jgi:hypothetical protein